MDPYDVLDSSLQAVEAYFETLGASVEQAWSKSQNDHAVFPEISGRALREVPVPPEADAIGLLKFFTSRRRILPQEDLGFGQPPLTLYRGRDFYISALYWLDGTTTIHHHAFSGAFRVLVGSSIHTGYSFTAQEAVRENLVLGDLDFGSAELLQRGDVREIVCGNQFIHALFHLDRPSVTVVVRTNTEHFGLPQYEYLRPGLAFDPFYKDETLNRQLFGLSTLYGIAPVEAARCARAMISVNDIFATFFVLKQWAKLSRGNDFDALLEHAQHRHGSVADILVPVFDEKKRQFNIFARRRLVHDPGHRLLMALILNLPDRTSVYAILKQLFPDQLPGQVLARWVDELSAPQHSGVSGFLLNDSDREVLRTALESDADEGSVEKALSSLSSKVSTTPLLELLLG